MRAKSKDFFWASFTDLMISLFFIMLVLYVLTFVRLKIQQKATEAQLNKIKEIQAAVKELPQEYFTYQSEFKRSRRPEIFIHLFILPKNFIL